MCCHVEGDYTTSGVRSLSPAPILCAGRNSGLPDLDGERTHRVPSDDYYVLDLYGAPYKGNRV